MGLPKACKDGPATGKIFGFVCLLKLLSKKCCQGILFPKEKAEWSSNQGDQSVQEESLPGQVLCKLDSSCKTVLSSDKWFFEEKEHRVVLHHTRRFSETEMCIDKAEHRVNERKEAKN